MHASSANNELSSMCNSRYRTARLLHTVAMRLRKHTRKLGAFQAWNKCLNHLLELARAHVEAVMLTNILDGANKCEDLDARKSIKVPLLFSSFGVCCSALDSSFQLMWSSANFEHV